MLQCMPALMQESIALGQAWGMRKEQELIRELEHEAGAAPAIDEPMPVAPPPVVLDEVH